MLIGDLQERPTLGTVGVVHLLELVQIAIQLFCADATERQRKQLELTVVAD